MKNYPLAGGEKMPAGSLRLIHNIYSLSREFKKAMGEIRPVIRKQIGETEFNAGEREAPPRLAISKDRSSDKKQDMIELVSMRDENRA